MEILAGVIVVIIIAVSGLAIYANHAGRESMRARQESRDMDNAIKAARATQAMAQAEANKPAGRTELIDRLEKEDV